MEKRSTVSVRRQCQLLNLTRSSLYYSKQPENTEKLALMRLVDQQYTKMPYYGVRRMTAFLQQQGYLVNHKRIRRLMRLMGLEALYPKPKLSKRNPTHKVYPYLLKGLSITRANQVWAADITYIPVRQGFVYLFAIMDWHSRCVLAWRVSTSLDTGFCLDALEEATATYGNPEIFNTDQGCQFTSYDWIQALVSRGIQVSMDGRGRYLDNIFVERLWRSVKYEEVYPKQYETVKEAKQGLDSYLKLYNSERLHQSLDYQTPKVVYLVGCGKAIESCASAKHTANAVPSPTIQHLYHTDDDELTIVRKVMNPLRA
jgi:putative transposase